MTDSFSTKQRSWRRKHSNVKTSNEQHKFCYSLREKNLHHIFAVASTMEQILQSNNKNLIDHIKTVLPPAAAPPVHAPTQPQANGDEETAEDGTNANSQSTGGTVDGTADPAMLVGLASTLQLLLMEMHHRGCTKSRRVEQQTCE